MAVHKIFTVFLVVAGPCAWTSPQLSKATSTTPVPILRYIDNQNIDGSYTFGFEGGDGTYKLETRFTDGRVKGKYGYYDPEGVLREATYGAEAGRGFEPQIDGVELPPPTIVEEIQFEIPQKLEPEITKPQMFKNFKDQNVVRKKKPAPHSERAPVQEPSKVKIVNGRRAVLKKRLRAKATPAPAQFVNPPVRRDDNLRARQEKLKSLRDHRQQLLQLQQAGGRQSSVRSFTGFRQTQQEPARSTAPTAIVRDPYVRGLDIQSGAYSYSYRK